MIDVASTFSILGIAMVGTWVAYSICRDRNVKEVVKPCIVCVAIRDRHAREGLDRYDYGFGSRNDGDDESTLDAGKQEWIGRATYSPC
jgi:hypothetical protein